METKRDIPLRVSQAAKMLSKLGASKGGIAARAATPPEERKEQARRASMKRWSLYRATHPVRYTDKLSVTELQILAGLSSVGSRMLICFDPSKLPTGARLLVAARRLEKRGTVRILDENVRGATTTLLVERIGGTT